MKIINAPTPPQLSLALHAQARLLSGRSLHEAATALANELTTALLLTSAHIGLVGKGSAKLVARTSSNSPDSKTLDDPAVTAAMDEAIDQAAVIVFPPQSEDDALHVSRAHAVLSRSAGARICSVPMLAGETIIGGLLLETDAEEGFPPHTLALLEQIAALAGPVLDLRRRAEAPLLERFSRALTAARQRGLGASRALMLAGGCAVLAGLLVPVDRTLTAEARIEGEIQRSLVAPADGFIEKAFVRPGDAVRQGQVLLQLADRDLQLERRRLESELAQYQNAFAAAQSQADRSQMVVSDARAEEAGARIALIDHQLERSLLRAPMDAVVLTGDLDQAQGTPVARGEVLLVVAPQARYRLMIEVDEREVGLLTNGARGELALSALPDTAIPFTVKRIMPVTTERDGRHFVAVEAELDHPPAEAQPGMRGYARIEAGSAALLGQLTHRVRAWLGLELWARTGL